MVVNTINRKEGKIWHACQLMTTSRSFDLHPKTARHPQSMRLANPAQGKLKIWASSMQEIILEHVSLALEQDSQQPPVLEPSDLRFHVWCVVPDIGAVLGLVCAVQTMPKSVCIASHCS